MEFHGLPTPVVEFLGSAAEAEATPFIDVVELSHNALYYLAVISVPQALTLDGGFNVLEFGINSGGHVLMHGITSGGSIFVNPRNMLRRRMQLCPDEPWGLSFHLPGPIDLTESEIVGSSTCIKLTARKQL